jgi:phage terminase Nu1 subunit (DNA packaging protein)
MEQVEKRIMEKAERARSVNASRSRGNITDSTFYMAQSELSDARERWHETRASVIQTGRKLAELQQERMRVAVEAEIAREQDLKQAMQSVSEEEVTTAVIGNLLSTIPDTYGRRRVDQQVSFTVVRRTASGPTRMAAGEDVTLQPGDLLQVVPAGEAVVHGPSGSAAGVPSSM